MCGRVGACVCVGLGGIFLNRFFFGEYSYCCIHTYKFDIHVHVGVTVLLISHEETKSGTRTFHDVCCSKLLTFHDSFLFLLLVAISSTLADFKPFLMCTRCSLKSTKCFRQLREAEKHETIVASQKLRTGDILSTAQDSTAHDSTGEQCRQGNAETDRQSMRQHSTKQHSSTPQRNPPLLPSSQKQNTKNLKIKKQKNSARSFGKLTVVNFCFLSERKQEKHLFLKKTQETLKHTHFLRVRVGCVCGRVWLCGRVRVRV